MKCYQVLLSALVLLAAAKNVSAATAIIDIPAGNFGSGSGEAHGNGMVGWNFRVFNTITVTQVGWYDAGGDGLSRAFQVGLWQDLSNGNFNPGSPTTQLLGTSNSGITIPAGTAATLDGFWRVVDLPTPLVLSPGTYQLGGLDSAATPDPIQYVSALVVNLSNSNLGADQFFFGSTNSAPAGLQVTNSNGFYLAGGVELGPMLFAIPEPSSCLLVFSGTVLLAFRRRK